MRISLRFKTLLQFSVIAIGFSIASTSSASAAAPWGSISFDGSNYLSATNMSAPGSGAFTYELWFYSTLETTTHQVVMNTRSNVSAPQPRDGFDLLIGSDRSFAATYRSVGLVSVGAGSIAVNRWYHFAFVRIGNTVYGYLDGSLLGSHPLDSDGLNFSSQKLTLGSTLNGGNKFTGLISNFRYTKSALYNSNFTKPTDDYSAEANTSILMNTKNDSSFITSSVAGITFTNNGSVTSSALNPFEIVLTQAERDAQALAASKEAQRKAEAARQVEIKATRELINLALVTKTPVTPADLVKADLPIATVESLNLVYQELISIKYALTAPLSPEALAEIKFNKFMKYAMYERMTGVNSGEVIGRDLVKFGVIPEETLMKQLTTYQLMKRPLAERDSINKVNQFFSEANERFVATKARLAAVIARSQSR